MRLEYKSESSKKFWESEGKGNAVTVRFGKIGTGCRTRTTRFSSPKEAENEYRKRVCEKLVKGYKPTRETVAKLLLGAMSVETPMAISSLYIGEHVPDEVARDICGWATACIQYGMALKQFRGVWEKFMEGDEGLTEHFDGGLWNDSGKEDAELAEALGWTEEDFWTDVTEWGEGELHELYAKAVENSGDRFIWFDNNAHISIVALRGDPGARAIEACVFQEKNCKNDKGQWLNNWPDELGPGAPIVSMSCDDATLRDGRTYSATH